MPALSIDFSRFDPTITLIFLIIGGALAAFRIADWRRMTKSAAIINFILFLSAGLIFSYMSGNIGYNLVAYVVAFCLTAWFFLANAERFTFISGASKKKTL
jgi:peptidoglycan/LPS O-acetylase OafA/YrhL